MIDIAKKLGENEYQFIWRLAQQKEAGLLDMDWEELSSVINKEFREDESEYKTEAAYRKPYSQAKKFYEAGVFNSLNEDKYIKELELQKQEIKKEKQKLSDERLDLNRRLRETSRLETTIDKIEEMLKSISEKRYVSYSPTFVKSDTDVIVCLSDLHIGASYYGFDGCYDSQIALERLNQYLSEVLAIATMHKAENCHVVLLGDLLSGSIHKTVSITNKENVIEQVKMACEYIADFVYALGMYFNKVTLHAVSGNHSRMDKKEDALLGERLDVLIPWFVKAMTGKCQNIEVADSELDDTLSAFFIKDKLYFAVHGDFDATNDAAIAKLALWVKATPYCVLCGHKHYPAMTEVSGIKVVQSGSLGGSGDEFTRQKRLTGKASQTVLVVNEKGIKAYYPVELES